MTNIQNMWKEHDKIVYEYMRNIIKNSHAESFCELGTFVGTTAKEVWDSIKDTSKKLYLVDNYFFLPEHRRKIFFDHIIKNIDPTTKNIIPILASSHDYNWQQHDFILFGHHSIEHFEKDFQTLMNSTVKYFFIKSSENNFHYTKRIYELINNKQSKYVPKYFLRGRYIFGHKDIPCDCDLPTKKAELFGHEIKYIPPDDPDEYINRVFLAKNTGLKEEIIKT